MNTALLTSSNPLKVRVVKIGKSIVSLSLPDHQSFQVSKKYLPEKIQEGDILYLDFVGQNQLNQSKKEIAERVLMEILG